MSRVEILEQKGLFSPIIAILIMIIFGGVGAYFSLNQPIQRPPIQTPTPTPSTPTPGPITVVGEIACLPKRDSGAGFSTLECAIGLRETNGQHYGLKNLFQHDPEHKFSETGSRVEVSGTFVPEEMLGPGGTKYDVVGTINVTSIIGVAESN